MESAIMLLELVRAMVITHYLLVLCKTFLVRMTALEMVSVPQQPEFANANILSNLMIVL
jgi:hypothetical protein